MFSIQEDVLHWASLSSKSSILLLLLLEDLEDMENTYFPHCLKKGTSGQPILNLKMENILEDNNQNGGFGGQSGPMENILLNGEHLTPMLAIYRRRIPQVPLKR